MPQSENVLGLPRSIDIQTNDWPTSIWALPIVILPTFFRISEYLRHTVHESWRLQGTYQRSETALSKANTGPPEWTHLICCFQAQKAGLSLLYASLLQHSQAEPSMRCSSSIWPACKQLDAPGSAKSDMFPHN